MGIRKGCLKGAWGGPQAHHKHIIFLNKFCIEVLIKIFSNDFLNLNPMTILKVCLRCAWGGPSSTPQAHLFLINFE